MEPVRIGEELGLYHVELHEEVSSTQDVARNCSMPPPYLVAARSQTKGRGRMGRTWVSEPGGLYFTLVTEPVPESWAVPLVCAHLVREELLGQVDCLTLKWPNDILHREGKLAGVMVECWDDGACGQSRLGIGIGVNVNQEWARGTYDVAATSLFMLSGRIFDLERMLCSLTRVLMRGVDELGEKGFVGFHPRVREVLLASRQPVKFIRGGQLVTAELYDIDTRGNGLVLTSDGERVELSLAHLAGG